MAKEIVDVDAIQDETVSVEMQNYSDVMNELRSSQELCTQLETRCSEQSTELEQTKATLEENQQAFDVKFLRRFSCPLFSIRNTRTASLM